MLQEKLLRQLGATGIKVSPLGIGTNRWVYGKNDKAVSQAFHAYLDEGVNFFDTADVYDIGKSERLLGDVSGKTHDRLSSPANICLSPSINSRKRWMAA